MGKIKILSDCSGTYKIGSVVKLYDFIDDYSKRQWDGQWRFYLSRIPMVDAAEIIAKELGIDYKFV